MSNGRNIAFLMAEVAIPNYLFADILRLTAEPRPPYRQPQPISKIMRKGQRGQRPSWSGATTRCGSRERLSTGKPKRSRWSVVKHRLSPASTFRMRS